MDISNKKVDYSTPHELEVCRYLELIIELTRAGLRALADDDPILLVEILDRRQQQIDSMEQAGMELTDQDEPKLRQELFILDKELTCRAEALQQQYISSLASTRQEKIIQSYGQEILRPAQVLDLKE